MDKEYDVVKFIEKELEVDRQQDLQHVMEKYPVVNDTILNLKKTVFDLETHVKKLETEVIRLQHESTPNKRNPRG